MEFLEKNLEDIIFETSTEDLLSRNLKVSGKRYRQLRIGSYGVADLVTLEKVNQFEDTILQITVYELKKDKINISSLSQASRYVTGIKRYFEQNNKFVFTEIDYKIVLVGKNIETSGDFVYLTDFLATSVDCYTYDYKFDGLSFKLHYGWKMKDEKF
jgi:hypothetical protein